MKIYAIVRCGLTPFVLVAKLLSLTFRMQICRMKSVRNWTVLLTLSALACACGGKNAGVKSTKVIAASDASCRERGDRARSGGSL